MHYNIDLGIDGNFDNVNDGVDDDWVVFYEDETNGLTYLIAADYVPNSNTTLQTALAAAHLKPSGTYGVYQDTESKFPYTDMTSAGVSAGVARNRLTWNGTVNKLKHKATASLLDTTAWSGFALTNVPGTQAGDIQAVGGPTVDLWVASWIQRGYTPLYLGTNVAGETAEGSNYAKTYGSGYLISSTNPPSASSYSIGTSGLSKTGYSSSDATVNNPVYFPHTSAVSSCSGYWLASPTADTKTADVMYVNYVGSVFYNNFTYYTYGVRPVVSLQSNIIGNDNTSDIYYAN